MFWRGVFAFLNSTDRLNVHSLTQNSFYSECFQEGAERSLRREGGGCWQAVNWCLSVHIVSFRSIYAELSAIPKTNQEELEIALSDGFKVYFHFLGWLETVTTAPGIILWNFIGSVSLKERCYKQPQFLHNLDISWGGPCWAPSKARSWDKNSIWKCNYRPNHSASALLWLRLPELKYDCTI